MQIQLLLLELSRIFFLNIFNPWLVESKYVEPMDVRGQLQMYSKHAQSHPPTHTHTHTRTPTCILLPSQCLSQDFLQITSPLITINYNAIVVKLRNKQLPFRGICRSNECIIHKHKGRRGKQFSRLTAYPAVSFKSSKVEFHQHVLHLSVSLLTQITDLLPPPVSFLAGP